MIVIDASAALTGLLNDGDGRRLLGTEQLHAPHLIDSEVASVVRRRSARGELPPADGWTILQVWQQLGVIRYGLHGLLERVWELRRNLSAYDAGYVALAEALGCTLVTADARLGAAPGLRCPVTVIPR